MTRHATVLAALALLAACAAESEEPAEGSRSTMDLMREQAAPAEETAQPETTPTEEEAASMMPEPDLETTLDAASPAVSDQDVQAAQEQMEQTREALGEQLPQGDRAETATPEAM